MILMVSRRDLDDGIIIWIVCRGNLQRACPEFHGNVLIRDYWNQPVRIGTITSLPCNSGIFHPQDGPPQQYPQDRFRTCGGDGNIVTGAISKHIFEIVQIPGSSLYSTPGLKPQYAVRETS